MQHVIGRIRCFLFLCALPVLGLSCRPDISQYPEYKKKIKELENQAAQYQELQMLVEQLDSTYFRIELLETEKYCSDTIFTGALRLFENACAQGKAAIAKHQKQLKNQQIRRQRHFQQPLVSAMADLDKMSWESKQMIADLKGVLAMAAHALQLLQEKTTDNSDLQKQQPKKILQN